jgi:hypothetical protein
MPDFGIFRGFNEKLFGDKLYAGQLPTELGIIGSEEVKDLDADAAAFFARVTFAGGTLTITEQAAIESLVFDLKRDGIWTKMKAIYPMVGASAAACAQNLKSASFTGTFNGGWVFSSNGIQGNGSNTFLNTFLVPNVVMNFNSQSYFIYKTAGQSGDFMSEFGAVNGGFEGVQMFINNGYNTINEFVLNGTFTISLLGGAYILNRNNSNDKKLFRNGTLVQTITSAASNYTLPNLYLGGRNRGGANEAPSNTQTRFFSTGDGLTDTEASNFYTAVQAFQTTLSRQI